MIYRNGWVRRLLVSRTLGTLATTAALAVAFAAASSSLSLAQTKKPPAKKPAAEQPKEPAQTPQQPGAGAQAQPPHFIYSSWTKFCRKDEQTGGKQICFTGMDVRLETGMMVGNMVVIELEGQPKMFRISVPIAVQLPPGTRLVIDQGSEQGQIFTAPYRFCGPDAPLCFAEYEMTPEVLAKFKKSHTVNVQAVPLNGQQAFSIPLPMASFAKAYDGPPTDPKVFAEQQKKMQEELQKKADEARKQLEAQHPTPTPGKTQ